MEKKKNARCVLITGPIVKTHILMSFAQDHTVYERLRFTLYPHTASKSAILQHVPHPVNASIFQISLTRTECSDR